MSAINFVPVNYFEQIKRISNLLMKFIKKRVEYNRYDEKLCICFDIDETVISTVVNSDDLIDSFFGYDTKLVEKLKELKNSGCHCPLPYMVNVYQMCCNLGIACIFITARPSIPEVQERTITNLRLCGYTDIAGIFFTNNVVKSDVRKKLVEEHKYTIIAMVGDQPDMDFNGGY